MEAKVILIKKYENRRLYDTLNSRYVNLEEVAKMLQDGATVRVLDVATGEDITRLILTQIIVEDAKAPDSIFPVEVLRQMVLASSRATQEGALRYMQAVMEMYQRSFRMMTPGFSWPGSAPSGFGPAPAPANGTEKDVKDRVERSSEEQHAERPPTPAASDEIQQLRSRLAELEAAISGLQPKSPRQKRQGIRDRP